MKAPKELLLNKGWSVRDEDISLKKDTYKKVIRKKKWMPAHIPGDIRLDLIREGKIKEPTVGTNAFDSEWIEEKSWWYKNEFTVPGSWKKYENIDLFCESLDIGADIFINSEWIGFHPTAYRPFILDIKPFLKFGKTETNLIVIRLTSGNFDLPEDILKFANEFNPDREKSRAPHRYEATHPFLRKPAYVFGWDWMGRMATCGIAGEVKLIPRGKAHINEVYVTSKPIRKKTSEIEVEIDLTKNSYFSDCRAAIHTTVLDGKAKLFQRIQQIDMLSGFNKVGMKFDIHDPKEWWPSGSGKQNTYTINVELYDNDKLLDSRSVDFGIRTVQIEQQKLSDTERRFTFIINGKPIYCRGANWVPADPFPSRITPAKYETLISEAAEAGFNMLRVWGGGLYEPDLFYSLCDTYGLMVWQDFAFACAAYPEHEDFRCEVAKEAEYQIKRLRNHPSIVLWCGNNENNWGSLAWGGWDITKEWGGSLYADILPKAVALHDPATPYWTSSPWGGETPNSQDAGDTHCWDWAWSVKPKERITPELFDTLTAKFCSEYGHIGPPVKESVLEYLGNTKHYKLDDPVFVEHTNIFHRDPDTVKLGISEFYMNPEAISVDDYIFYGGLVQGGMYEYTLESFRYRRPECSGVMFWMYNDAWGEIGWTIIDYYLRRKPSWYFVKRAYSPVKVIIRREAENANIRIINDRPGSVDGELQFGYAPYDGSKGDVKSLYAHVVEGSLSNAASLPLDTYDLKKGCLFAVFRDKNKEIEETAVYRHAPFRKLSIPTPEVLITKTEKASGGMYVTVSSETYAHAVHFTNLKKGIPGDSFFDLLPGTKKRVFIKNGKDGIKVKAVRP